MTYISTQSLSFPLRQSVLQMQSSLAQAQQELSTGVHADLGLTLGAKTGTSLSLKSQIDSLGTFKTTNSLVDTRLSSTSTVLDTLLSSAQSMSATLVTASSAGGLTSSVTAAAKGALSGLVAGLNTSTGDQYVFGGINTDAAPVADYNATSAAKTAVDAAFQQKFGTSQDSAAASSISGSDMSSFLENQFAALFDSSNWQANWSSASDQTMQSRIAPSQSISTSVSANESAFRQMAQAYTMLSEFTGANLSDAARSAVVTKANSLISSAIASLTNVQSGVGVAQAAITRADTQSTAQVTLLTSSVEDMESVDPYALSAKVSSLQTQLESSYELTSRLQKLSLTNYLG